MPVVSPAQKRLMEAAAHTEGGYGGVPQAVGKKFIAGDMSDEEWDGLIEGMERFLKEEKAEPAHASDRQTIDFGPKSGRKYDKQNGFLHVRCHISKACVNPYRGKEIPGWEALGLDADKIYQLFRDPKALKAGAATFHNVPLMSGETGVGGGHPEGGVTSADEHLIKIGSIANPSFEHPYLDADVVVWNDTPIAGIDTDTVRELSSSYGYKPVMEPGKYQDVDYDGRMTDIHANHVALVEAGRAGSDVIVGDAALETGEFLMALKPRVSVKAALARGAVVATIRPLLAADVKLDMAPINTVLAGITSKNWLQQKPRLATAIMGALRKVKLASDEKEAEEEVNEALDSLDDETADGELEKETGAEKARDAEETEEEKGERMKRRADDRKRGMDCAADEDPETEEEKEHRMEARDRRAKDKRMGKDASEEDREEAEKEHKAEDAKAWNARMRGRDAKPKGMDKKAMDAAIRAAEERTETRVIARLNSIAEARADVLPFVGEFSGAADSAREIYEFALDQAGQDHDGITDVKALRAMVKMLRKPSNDGGVSGGFAVDALGGAGGGSHGSDDWLKSFGVPA